MSWSEFVVDLTYLIKVLKYFQKQVVRHNKGGQFSVQYSSKLRFSDELELVSLVLKMV